MSTVAAICFHCGAAIPAAARFEENAEGTAVRFCCRGCHGAYLLIVGAGLESFYRTRESADGSVPARYDTEYGEEFLSRFVYPCGDASAIDIIIEGMHCASCITLNEKFLARLPGVREVRINYATGRARVAFDPGEVSPKGIFDRISALGYRPRPYTPSTAQESAERERRGLLIRFGTAFFLSMQLMAYAFALYAGYFQGMGPQMKQVLQFFSLAVTTPVVFYCGWPFLAGAWRSLKNRAPDMELLISIGALSSYGYSIYASFTAGEVYYETAAMIVTLILAGRLLENAARRRAASGIQGLLSLNAGTARRFKGEELETVDIAHLVPGDLVLVGPGERFPVDGTVTEGSTEVDESPVNGEPLPVFKAPGDSALAGSTSLTGAVRVLCEKPAAESFIGRIIRLVEEAQNRRAPIQGVADRVAAFFVPLVLALSFGTFCWHFLNGAPLPHALMTALSVLVIACPCALGLATPTAIMAGSAAGAAMGVIFKGGDILERLSRVNAVFFDKTGTVTCGSPAVVAVHPAQGISATTAIALAAAVESGSLHPIGRAICAYAAETRVPYEVGENLQTVPGGGVSGVVGGCEVSVGSAAFLLKGAVQGISEETPAEPGETAVLIAADGRFIALILLQDRLRQEAAEVVSYFNGHHAATTLLSGDRRATVAHFAGLLGMREALGEVSPAEKAQRVSAARKGGGAVLMVGDGINDAPALSAADIGCAIAGGTDIAIETSDLVLARPDLALLPRAHALARRTMAVVRQNLVWAFLYNVIGIPLAMTGRLTPVYAAAAMALSSLCVVGNSLRMGGRKRG